MNRQPQPRTGICKLCQKEADLQLSHIVPKFIFTWMKKTGDGNLRSGSDFNKRRQDGYKVYMLCKSCEGIFGKLETYFSSKVFFPFVNGSQSQIDYDERLFKFVISVIWRYFHFDFLESEKGTFSYPVMLEAELEWRNYLLDVAKAKRFTSIHLLPFGVLLEDSGSIDDKLFNRLIRYLARNVDAAVTDNCQDYSISFVKLPRFCFVIPLEGFDETLVSGTAIHPEGGTYILNEAMCKDPRISELIMDRIRQLEEGLESMSSKQKQKIANVKAIKWPDLKDKDLGQIMRFASQFRDKK